MFISLGQRLSVGLCVGCFSLVAQATVKPITVKAVLTGIDTCLAAQAQSVTNQIQAGLDRVTVSLSDGSVSASIHDESDDRELQMDSNNAMFVPKVNLRGHWAQGDCDEAYGKIGYSEKGTFEFAKTRYCPSSTKDDENPLELELPDGAFPALWYANANRSATFNGLGERTPLNDLITDLSFTPATSGTPGSVQFLNASTDHITNVTLNVATYSACLQKTFGF